jgi:16S rRNA (guanine966-N2)-methyltransferase
MSIVHALLPGARIVDLFAGSGALGLEALSRGAGSADLVEEAPAILRVLRANVTALGAEESAHVIRADAIRFIQALGPGTYDVAFADPPYASGLAAAVAERWLSAPFAGVLGVEHAAGAAVPAGGTTRRYGSTAVTFYGL